MSNIEPVHQENSEIPVIVDQEKFTIELQNYYSRHSENSKKLEWTNQRIQSVIKLLDEYNTIKVQGRRPTNKHYHHARKYDVMNIGNQKVLIMKRKDISDPVVQIIPTEEYYQKILDAHIASGHGRRDKIVHALKDKYVVPIFAVLIFLNLCKTCLSKKSFPKKGTVVKPLISDNISRRGQIDLVDFQSSSDQEYKCLLQYQDIPEDDPTPKSKKLKQDYYSIVKKCCMELVTLHGRSVTLFDDKAFRTLIDMIPMTDKEKEKINSSYIQKCLDNEDDDGNDSGDMEISVNADKPRSDAESSENIKAEVVELPQCSCTKDGEDLIEKHQVDCPAASQLPYYNYFEVTADTATCLICKKELTWTNISKLKDHLVSKHPNTEFVDDDEEFQHGPESSIGSHEEMEEIFLNEDVLADDTFNQTPKKRKKPNISFPACPSRESIEASLVRFKSLDSFGGYVASLMKLLPKEKCIRFQIQIVERLLQEQAAAG